MLKTITSTLYSIWAWIFIGSAFISHALIASIMCLFSKDREKTYYWTCLPPLKFGYKVSGIKINLEGQENLPKKGPLVLIANHQSHLDILTLLIASPIKLSFFAKEELLKIPFLGRAIREQGHFWVNRGNARKALQQLNHVKQELKKGKSVLIFPSGTRCPEGEVGQFKRGAFQMALEAKAPLIPVCISGSAHILSKGSWWVQSGNVTVRFGKVEQPVPEDNIPKQAKALAKDYEEKVKALF